MGAPPPRPWKGLIVVALLHAATILTLAIMSAKTNVADVGVAHAISLGSATVVFAAWRAGRSALAVLAWGACVLVVYSMLATLGRPPGEVGVVALAWALDAAAFLAYTSQRTRGSVATRGGVPRSDISLVLGSVQFVVLAAWLVDRELVADLQVATAILVLTGAALRGPDSAWSSTARVRLDGGHVIAARRAIARGLAIDIGLYASVVVALAILARPLIDLTLGPDFHGVAAATVAGAWLIPVRLLGGFLSRRLILPRHLLLTVGASGVLAALIATMTSVDGSLWVLAMAVVGWVAWCGTISRRTSSGGSGPMFGRYVVGPAMRGSFGGCMAATGVVLVTSPTNAKLLIVGPLMMVASVFLLLPEMAGIVRGRSARPRPGTHALIVPAGEPSLLGGPRSTLEGWSRSPIGATVLTKPGSRAAAYAAGLGFPTMAVAPPNPARSGQMLARIFLASRWIARDGLKLTRFETAEVEQNHVLEILPSALWYGVPLITSVRDFPQRAPGSRTKKVLYAAPAATYCINDGIRRWLREKAGLAGVSTVRIPVLPSRPMFDLASADHHRTLVVVGGISPKKGQLRLVREVLDSLQGWRTVFVGSPGHDHAYVAAVEEAIAGIASPVVLAGQLDNWRQAFHGRFVLGINSVSEGGPRVAVEALAWGIPVVMADFPGSEAFRQVPFVWIVKDPDQWRQALEDAHRAELDAGARSVLEDFLTKYRRDVVGEQLVSFWLCEDLEEEVSDRRSDASVPA